MARHRHAPEFSQDAQRWVLPYADFVTLLLAFFVMLYSVSFVDKEQYPEISSVLKSLTQGQFVPSSVAPKVAADMKDDSDPQPNKMYIKNSNPVISTPGQHQGVQPIDLGSLWSGHPEIDFLKNHLVSQLSDKQFSIQPQPYGIELNIDGEVLFESGRTELSDHAVQLIAQVAHTLQPMRYPIVIAGYSDSVPINNSIFPSNWELSAARAAAVVRELVRLGVPASRLTVLGFGQHKPVASNQTSQGRQLNRRISVRLLVGYSLMQSLTLEGETMRHP